MSAYKFSQQRKYPAIIDDYYWCTIYLPLNDHLFTSSRYPRFLLFTLNTHIRFQQSMSDVFFFIKHLLTIRPQAERCGSWVDMSPLYLFPTISAVVGAFSVLSYLQTMHPLFLILAWETSLLSEAVYLYVVPVWCKKALWARRMKEKKNKTQQQIKQKITGW